MAEFLNYEKSGAIVTLTMNRPDIRNALSGAEAINEIVDACDTITKDLSVRVVILTGAGPAFSSGGNVKTMRENVGRGAGEPAMVRYSYKNGIQRIPLALYNLEVPTIAAVNGPAVGAGNDVACMCDIRIASDRASFAESFVKLGIIPGDGGAWLLPRAVGMSKASEMAFTGAPISAEEALACGLVSQVVPHDQLMEKAQELAQKIAANPGHALRMTKRLLREGQHTRLETLLEMSASFQALAHHTRQHEEAVNAFIEKRPPNFTDE
ncbi:crotonase/enoyl-CoA hydratase family protein [Noviherbaspirillum sp.]|uniref:crotonase/enoyl-CoA hydratase family protein n=1 Tax=Noviherbaspirillum sp. TaxID=1926288 RepID=UPI002FE3AB65